MPKPLDTKLYITKLDVSMAQHHFKSPMSLSGTSMHPPWSISDIIAYNNLNPSSPRSRSPKGHTHKWYSTSVPKSRRLTSFFFYKSRYLWNSPLSRFHHENSRSKLFVTSRISQVIHYCQTSNIRHTLVNKKLDHSDVVGASPVGAAPNTSSFLT